MRPQSEFVAAIATKKNGLSFSTDMGVPCPFEGGPSALISKQTMEDCRKDQDGADGTRYVFTPYVHLVGSRAHISFYQPQRCSSENGSLPSLLIINSRLKSSRLHPHRLPRTMTGLKDLNHRNAQNIHPLPLATSRTDHHKATRLSPTLNFSLCSVRIWELEKTCSQRMVHLGSMILLMVVSMWTAMIGRVFF